MLGIVNLASANLRRRLDAAGDISIEVGSTDPKAVELLAIRRRVRVYTDRPGFGKKLVGSGVLLQRSFSDQAGNKRTSWQCTDSLEALRNESTLRGLIYDDMELDDVVRDLVGRAGWKATFDTVEGSTSQRFDAQSLLQALTEVATRHGYHFRLAGESTIEFGVMGRDSGVRLMQAGNARISEGSVALIDRLEIVQDGYEIINWIEPIAGPVDGGLTLKRSTRSDPYTIETTEGPNGQTVYYLKDDASIAQYGRVSAVVSPKQLIVPVEASQTALINAANVLYEWGVTFLRRHREPQVTYRVSAVKVDKVIKVGDKVRVSYKGIAYQKGVAVRYAEVDDDFWVLEVNERHGMMGSGVDLTISNIDQMALDAVDIVVDNITGRTIDGLGVQMNVDRSEVTETITVAKGAPDTVTFQVRRTTVEVGSCRVQVTRVDASLQVMAVYLDDVEIDGGPWYWGASAEDSITIEMADVLNEISPLAGEHILTFECLYGTSDLDVVVNLVEAIVPGVSVPPEPFLGREFKIAHDG